MPALLMDLDGTIADTLPHLFASFRHAVQPFVARLPTDAEIVATFGPPERDCIQQVLHECNDVQLTVIPMDVDRAVARFHEFYEGGHAAVAAFPGIVEAIQWTRARGWRFGVQTGKGRRSAVFTLDRLGLGRDVEYLISGDDVQKPKPDPEGILKALKALHVLAAQMLVVGDMPADVQAGQAAGTKTAAAIWAAYDAEACRRSNPDWLLKSAADLRSVIEHWPA